MIKVLIFYIIHSRAVLFTPHHNSCNYCLFFNVRFYIGIKYYFCPFFFLISSPYSFLSSTYLNVVVFVLFLIYRNYISFLYTLMIPLSPVLKNTNTDTCSIHNKCFLLLIIIIAREATDTNSRVGGYCIVAWVSPVLQ